MGSCLCVDRRFLKEGWIFFSSLLVSVSSVARDAMLRFWGPGWTKSVSLCARQNESHASLHDSPFLALSHVIQLLSIAGVKGGVRAREDGREEASVSQGMRRGRAMVGERIRSLWSVLRVLAQGIPIDLLGNKIPATHGRCRHTYQPKRKDTHNKTTSTRGHNPPIQSFRAEVYGRSAAITALNRKGLAAHSDVNKKGKCPCVNS